VVGEHLERRFQLRLDPQRPVLERIAEPDLALVARTGLEEVEEALSPDQPRIGAAGGLEAKRLTQIPARQHGPVGQRLHADLFGPEIAVQGEDARDPRRVLRRLRREVPTGRKGPSAPT
jgi:hypothetical protein